MKDPGSISLSTSSGVPDKHTAKEALVHFATAFAFLITGLASLAWNSDQLSQGSFSDGRVVGGLHFITLGWLSLSIFGALRVFTGVALGSQGFGQSWVSSIRRIWTASAVLFPLGLMLNSPALILPGVIGIGSALALFTAHMVPALVKAKRGGLTRAYLSVAILSLWGTWLLGGIAGSLRAGVVTVALPQGYFLAHILLAVFGWVGSTVIGVGSHLIPMFALSRDASDVPAKIALPIWSSIPVFAALGAFFGSPYLEFGFVAAGCGSVLWFAQVAIYFRTRMRKERDPGLFLAGGATALLVASWIVGLMSKATDRAPLSFLSLVVIGWLTLFTLGIYHRVIPFLIWFARFARESGRGPVPKVKDLIDERLGLATAASTLTGICLWALGLLLGEAPCAYIGSFLVLAGSVLSLGQLRTLLGKPHAENLHASQAKTMKEGLVP